LADTDITTRKQFKTTFVGVVLLSVKNPPPHHHTTITIREVLDNPGSLFLACNFILTQPPDEMWKTTSIFLKMEDDLNFFENGRQPHFFFKWKTT
jgi:hypothetical protein